MRPVRSSLSALALVGAAIGLSACGGETVAAEPVRSAPPELTVPGGADAAADLASPRATPDATSTPDENADSSDSSTPSDSSSGSSSSDTGSSGSTGDAGTTSPDTTNSGTTAPSDGATGGTQAPSQDTQPDSAQDDSPPPAGSGAEQFEQFCQQNPGAC